MKYRAIIFDLDGTLLDTLADLADSTNAALSEMGFAPHPVPVYKSYIGEGREALALRSLPEGQRDKDTVSGLVTRITEHYYRRWVNRTRPYPGITAMLDGLTAHHVRLAILTNKPQDFTDMMVARFLSKWQFDIVVGASPAVPKKPDPKAALNIANTLEMKPSEIIYVGDSDIDMKTALAAGMYPVGALWGFRTADELLASGAKVLVKQPADILKLFKKLDNDY